MSAPVSVTEPSNPRPDIIELIEAVKEWPPEKQNELLWKEIAKLESALIEAHEIIKMFNSPVPEVEQWQHDNCHNAQPFWSATE